MQEHGLSGLVILVVEDDYYLAEELCFGLQEAGAQVLGPAPSVADAMRLSAVNSKLDAAVLDVNLNGEFSWPIVDVLLARNVPVLLATGYDSCVFPPQYCKLPRCEKPFMLTTLVARLLQQVATLKATTLA